MDARPALYGHTVAWQAIEAALDTVQSGRGGVLFITGESGIGKSLLAGKAAAVARESGLCVLKGRGSNSGLAIPFRPLTEALLGVVRTGDDRIGAAMGPYRPVLGRLIPDWADETPAASLVVLAEAVLRFTSAINGCLFILDDLHDADAETLAIAEYLFDNVLGQPTLLLGVLRDHPSRAFDVVQAAAWRGSGTMLTLNRFSRPDLVGFTAAALGVEPDRVPEAAIDRLWAGSAGHPLVAQELLDGMRRCGTLRMVEGSWLVAGSLDTSEMVSAGIDRLVAGRIGELSAEVRATLRIAAVFGDRFPHAVVGAAGCLTEPVLRTHLNDAVAAEFILTDESEPGWYRFRHPLTARALLAQCLPDERERLARLAAEAIAARFPGVPGQWCVLEAALRAQAGEPAAAARLYCLAGQRAQQSGAATSAIAAFERALELMESGSETLVAQEGLIHSLADAGQIEGALSIMETLAEPAGDDARIRRAELHTRLAWAADLAGTDEAGLAQVAAARAVLGKSAPEQLLAPIDAVAAQLTAEQPDRESYAAAMALARQAIAVAERVPLPAVACQSLRLLGSLIRRDDIDEANACFERAYALAQEHQLAEHRVKALFQLGADDSVRDGSLNRLIRARDEAQQIGAIAESYTAEASIALQLVLTGDFAEASLTCERIWPSISRMRLTATVQYLLIARASLAAHQGHRTEMDRALAELRRWGGGQSQFPPMAMGMARAFCALLEEDPVRALSELDSADRWEDEHASHYQLTGRYGIGVLLRVLHGLAGLAECVAAQAASPGRARWNRQFIQFAFAVAHSRAGDIEQAETAMAQALAASDRYEMARHLGLRLVSGEALKTGWGEPVAWLREAESYFFKAGAAPVASACRALLREAGAPVHQRRRGVERIPPALRSLGVTVREYDVLQLIAHQHGNRGIAGRLHISPRTVEKHVANLITKIGLADRSALREFAVSPQPHQPDC